MRDAIVKYKDDLFGLFTSLLIYTIMLPLIISEHRRVEQRYIDFDVFIIHFKQMPMTLYFLIITISLSTIVNFFRDILSVIKRYFNSKTGFNNQYSPYQNGYTGLNFNENTKTNFLNQGGVMTTPPVVESTNPHTYF